MNEVNSTTRNTQPYVDIGLIETTWADGTVSIGTCSLVGINDILTAGHCVYNPDAGGWGKNFKFYFGADYNSATGLYENYGENLSFGKWETIAWTSQIFTDSDDETMLQSESQYDIAVIGVDTPIGDTLGWLGLASGYDGSQTATAVGYPAGSTGMMRETAYVTKSSYFGIYESNVQVMGPGSSGGPLLIGDYVIGVKSTGYSWADIGFLYDNLTKAMAENDSLISGAVNVVGTSGNDTLIGGSGKPIDGLAGIDTVTYISNRGSMIHNSNGTWTVGSDTLTNIERLQFSDKNLALDIDGNAGKVAKILASVFGASAVSNKEYAGIGLKLIDGGMSYDALAALAINAAGAHTREAVVDLLWSNLMGSKPTAEQSKPLIDYLATDLSNVGSLGVIAADYAATIGVVNLDALSQTGLEYI